MRGLLPAVLGAIVAAVLSSADGTRAGGFVAGAAIAGRVRIADPATPAPPRPGITSLAADLVTAFPERRQAVVYLDPGPQGAFEAARPGRAVMNQYQERFVPHVLAVRVGTVVEFPNEDPFYHNVFSLSKPKPFDLGRYARGRSKSVRFDKPGVVRVFCDIHSHMSAFILVFAHRFFALTDEEGRYRIDAVPAGTYGVQVWYEGAVRRSRTLNVPAGQAGVQADFVLE